MKVVKINSNDKDIESPELDGLFNLYKERKSIYLNDAKVYRKISEGYEGDFFGSLILEKPKGYSENYTGLLLGSLGNIIESSEDKIDIVEARILAKVVILNIYWIKIWEHISSKFQKLIYWVNRCILSIMLLRNEWDQCDLDWILKNKNLPLVLDNAPDSVVIDTIVSIQGRI